MSERNDNTVELSSISNVLRVLKLRGIISALAMGATLTAATTSALAYIDRSQIKSVMKESMNEDSFLQDQTNEKFSALTGNSDIESICIDDLDDQRITSITGNSGGYVTQGRVVVSTIDIPYVGNLTLPFQDPDEVYLRTNSCHSLINGLNRIEEGELPIPSESNAIYTALHEWRHTQDPAASEFETSCSAVETIKNDKLGEYSASDEQIATIVSHVEYDARSGPSEYDVNKC